MSPTDSDYKQGVTLPSCYTKDAVLMVEAGANEVTEEVILKGIDFGHQAVKEVVALQEEVVQTIGKEKIEIPVFEVDEQLEKDVRDFAEEKIAKAVKNPDKLARQDALEALEKETTEHFEEIYPEQEKAVQSVFLTALKEIVRYDPNDGVVLMEGS